MGSSGINEVGIGSFTVYSVDENDNMECLGTLDGIEAVTMEKPEEEGRDKMIFSLLEPDKITFTAKMTFWTRIKLWFWYRKLMIQKRLIVGKFKRSFKKVAKAQAKHEKVLKGE